MRNYSRTSVIECFLGSLLDGFRFDLWEICCELVVVCQDSMRDDLEPPEDEESGPMKSIRAWRATERKKMIESMEKLLGLAQKLALSQYTRSSQRARYVRLAGQLLWYKDQILRGMTWEALEQDYRRLYRIVYEDHNKRMLPTWQRITPAPFVPNLVKKKEGPDAVEDSGDTVPEIMREEDTGVDDASSDASSDKDHDVGGGSNDPDPSRDSSDTDPETS